MMSKFYLFITSVMLVLSINTFAQPEPVAFINARIIPIVGEQIENGALVVQNGKIVFAGSAEVIAGRYDVVVDVSGKVIMPGLVDTHSHIGEGDGGDRCSTTHPDVRILDAVDPN